MRWRRWLHRRPDLARTGSVVLVTALLSLGAHTPSEAQKLNSALVLVGMCLTMRSVRTVNAWSTEPIKTPTTSGSCTV